MTVDECRQNSPGQKGRGRTLRVALLGAKGMLAHKMLENAPLRMEIHSFDLPEFDLTDQGLARQTLNALKPEIIINCAAFTAVDGCEARENEAYEINAEAVRLLAEVAARLEALLVHLSTDYVFDGRKTEPYMETDPVGPVSAYGRTKLAGENAILQADLARYLIVRTSWLFGPGGGNFVKSILGLAAEREELRVVEDQVGCPTYTGDLADAIYRLIEAVLSADDNQRQGLSGIYHFSNAGQCSWYQFALAVIEQAKALGMPVRVTKILPITSAEYPLPAARPAYSVLSKDRYRAATGCAVPGWQKGLHDYLVNDCSATSEKVYK